MNFCTKKREQVRAPLPNVVYATSVTRASADTDDIKAGDEQVQRPRRECTADSARAQAHTLQSVEVRQPVVGILQATPSGTNAKRAATRQQGCEAYGMSDVSDSNDTDRADSSDDEQAHRQYNEKVNFDFVGEKCRQIITLK